MLYTRKGDKGDSKVLQTPRGERISKADPLFELLGTLDELNTFVGLSRAHAQKEEMTVHDASLAALLERVQHYLFTLQAECAGADKQLKEEDTEFLEAYIDWVEQHVPPISSFLLPGGNELSALLDVTRAVTRRAERAAVRTHNGDSAPLTDPSMMFLNRLSSFFYALVRFVNHQVGADEAPPQYT